MIKKFGVILILIIICSFIGCIENNDINDKDELYIINIEHRIAFDNDYVSLRFVEDGNIKNINEKYMILKLSYDDNYHLYRNNNFFNSYSLYIPINITKNNR